MKSLLIELFSFIFAMVKKLNIDESHGIKHSMDVLQFAHEIYSYEVLTKKHLIKQEKIIYVSAALHDICDKKYVSEEEGIKYINDFLADKIEETEIKVVNDIITTMSYSKVKIHGFPDLEEYQTAYHIVREADLLAAYDFDRCMIYHMNNSGGDLEEAFDNANLLFEKRVFRHNQDNLFTTEYSKTKSLILEQNAKHKISRWYKILYKKIY